MNVRTYEGWIVLFTSGTDYEADLVRDRLDDSDIPAVILTQRDHAFNLTHGDLAQVNVLVPLDRAAEAKALLESEPLTDEELEEAALAAGPAPDAQTEEGEAMLDSGIESISFDVPDEKEENDDEAPPRA